MRVAITGSDGFVGHHLAAEFLRLGASVLGIDDGQAGARLTPKGVDHLPINTRHLVSSHLWDVDFVVHAAARADVSLNWESRQERDTLWRENIEGTIGLLEALPETCPVVFLSTGAIYGDAANGSEKAAYAMTSPYAASKLAGEGIVQSYAFKRKTPWWVFRLGCVVGSGYHHGHIADMVRAAQRGMFRAKNNGTTRKSFVHVSDVVAACTRVASPEGPSAQRGIYNLANGEWSWRDTLDVMRRTGKTQFAVTASENIHGWIGDPLARLDNIKARAAGFGFGYSIEQGVREALTTLGWK